jgi:ATP-dependent helicase HrpA
VVKQAAASILTEFGAAQRRDQGHQERTGGSAGCRIQQRLVPKRFWQSPGQLQHFVRYLKAITARLDKYRADLARTLRVWLNSNRRICATGAWSLAWGAVDSRMQEFRWLLEELSQLFRSGASHTNQSVPKNGKSLATTEQLKPGFSVDCQCPAVVGRGD